MNHIKQMPSTSASTAVAAVFHGLANVLHAAISPLAYWASMVLGVFTVDALEYVFPVTRTWFPVLLELIVLMVDRAFHGRLSTMMPPWTFLAVGVYFGLGMLLVVFVNLYGMALTLDLQPISQETGLVYVMVQKDVPCGPYNSNWFVYLVHTYLYVAGFLLFQALLLG
ncbi:unnamed protein product [Symbiodinium natans]|uniref:Uncharacterized protein n=1 Tax=Symbiodinium natans TaxID=878477 RepID=A0A812MVN9_9DINO|nr:unnamed protein product [Symbiodinium natans]